jgi:23S rRNA pseudouridine1911/1915/1917 synthase
MSFLRHALVGDQVYAGRQRIPAGAQPELVKFLQGFKRQALHAWRLTFEHPGDSRQVSFEAPLPEDMSRLIELLSADVEMNDG